MFFGALSITGLAASVSALALPTSDNNNTSPLVLTKREEGSCKDFNQLIEWQYNAGVYQFCNHWKPTWENPNPKKRIEINKPEIWTILLNNYKDNTPVPWVYNVEMSCTKGRPAGCAAPPIDVTHEKCVRKMKELLSEGKLGNEYCVVDGTEDVLFQHGKIEEEYPPFGWLKFESSRRNGEF